MVVLIVLPTLYLLRSFFFFLLSVHLFFFFFFNDTATTEIYTLSLTTLFRSSGSTSERPIAWPSARRNVKAMPPPITRDRKSTRLNSSHITISYAVFCLKKKKKTKI